jgi:hypothetical protein
MVKSRWVRKVAFWFQLGATVALGSVVLIAPAKAQPLSGLPVTPLADEVTFTVEGRTAVARLYRSPSDGGLYDKPVVIPMPFDPMEHTEQAVTPQKLYDLFSRLIVPGGERGYDFWIIQLKSSQNFHRQAALTAKVINHAAELLGANGKVIVGGYSGGGLTARLATARWEADPQWRVTHGLRDQLPVALVIFGDAPLTGAHVNVELQRGIEQLGGASRLNLVSCGAKSLLQRDSRGPSETHAQFFHLGTDVTFRAGADRYVRADRCFADEDATLHDCVCDGGPAVTTVNGDGWPHGPRIVAFSDGAQSTPQTCYGDSRDHTQSGESVCPQPGVPTPAALSIGQNMYKLRFPLAGDGFARAASEDVQPGSRLATALNERRCGLMGLICGGIDTYFSGTFIPLDSALPPGAPFYATRTNTYSGVHGSTPRATIDWLLNEMDAAWASGGGGGGGGGGGKCKVSRLPAPGLSTPTGCASNTTPRFSWSAVPGATFYKLFIADVTDPANEFDVLYNNVATTSTVVSLPAERRYRWKAKAQSNACDGDFPDSLYFTISSTCQPPTVPPVLVGPAGCVDQTRPTFTWASVPGATSYRIVVTPASEDNFFVDQHVTGTSLASPVALNPRIQYRFKVRAINDAGLGPWSNSMQFTPFCGGVATTISTPLGCSLPTPTFSWTPVAPAIGYWLLVSNNADFSAPGATWFVNHQLTGTSYSPGIAFAPGRYYVKVKTLLDPSSTTAAAWSATVLFDTSCLPTG